MDVPGREIKIDTISHIPAMTSPGDLYLPAACHQLSGLICIVAVFRDPAVEAELAVGLCMQQLAHEM